MTGSCLGQTHNYRAIVYFEMGEMDNALVHNNSALEYFERAGYDIGVASIKINIGNIRLFAGEFDEAVKLYYDGLEMLEAMQDTLRLTISYMNIGTLFYRNQYHEESLNYNFKALLWARKLQNPSIIADLHTNTANVYNFLNNTDAYLQYIDSAVTFARSANYLFGLMNSYNSLALHYHKTSDYDAALDYALLAADNAREYGNPANIADVYNTAGSIFLAKNNIDSAKVYLEKAIELSKTNGFLDVLSAARLNMSILFEKSSDFAGAYRELSEYLELHDSIFRMEKQRELQEMDRRYRVAEKENEIEQQSLTIALREREIRRQNIWVAFSIVMALVAIAFIFVVWQWMKNRNRLIAREVEEVKLKREKQVMNAVIQGEEKERQRIARELHDGINGNLAALKLQLTGIQNGRFDQLIDLTMDEVRTLSHNLVPDVVKKFGLHEALQQYITSLQRGSSLEVDCQFLGDTPVIHEDLAVQIYRIVQELVSNVLKHADASHLLVQVATGQSSISITIEDNGKGFEIDPKKGLSFPGKGIGLSGVENRITWLKGQFDIHSSTQSGTSVHIEIPVSQNVMS
jgi:two-component system, NarL family, sensor kinase